jgi:hypothetical protein
MAAGQRQAARRGAGGQHQAGVGQLAAVGQARVLADRSMASTRTPVRK